MLNWIFLFLVVGATLTAAFLGTMGEVTKASVDSAKSAVELAIGLVGQMALWLGVAQVLQDAGLMRVLARTVRPVMVWLFPGIPVGHPATGAILMNLAANMMGLTNAATPFGIKAMLELEKLNDRPGVATDEMALFLAINTSGVAVLPTGVIAVRAAMGAENVTGIFLPTIFATACSTVVAIIVAKLIVRLPWFSRSRYEAAEGPVKPLADIKGLGDAQAMADMERPLSPWRGRIALAVVAVLAAAFALQVMRGPDNQSALDIVKLASADWILPLLMVGFLLAGFSRSVPVYESVITGAKQGFSVAIMIIPFLVAILVAIGMFRASGAMGAMVELIGPITATFGLPAEALPMALIRPLSGSGALGVLMETMKTHGPDSFVGFLVSVMSGSTETTFYVLAVYFGAVGVRATRHTVIACLAADATGILMAVVFSRIFF